MKIRRIKGVKKPSDKKRKKKKLRRVLRLVKCLLTLGILVATAVYASRAPFFNIDAFRVKGSSHYSDESLASASGIVRGANGFRLLFDKPVGRFFFLRVGSAERAILESRPYVKNVKVRYLIPSTISIEVKEKEAAALLILEGTSLLIDREGYLLEINPENVKDGIPVIKGIKPGAYKPGKKMDIPQDAFSTAFEIYETIREMDSDSEKKLLPDVDFIDVGDLSKTGFSLQSRVLVNLGKPEDLNYKISAVKTIFSNNIKKNERGKLDFYSDGNPVFTPENGG